MPQGTTAPGVVPKIYTDNERKVRELNTKYIGLKKLYDEETIPQHKQELLVQLEDLLQQKYKLLPKRTKELKDAGYIPPRKNLLIPLP
jgi:hypothetical protein